MSAAGWAILGMVAMLITGFLAGIAFATDPEAGEPRHHYHAVRHPGATITTTYTSTETDEPA